MSFHRHSQLYRSKATSEPALHFNRHSLFQIMIKIYFADIQQNSTTSLPTLNAAVDSNVKSCRCVKYRNKIEQTKDVNCTKWHTASLGDLSSKLNCNRYCQSCKLLHQIITANSIRFSRTKSDCKAEEMSNNT